MVVGPDGSRQQPRNEKRNGQEMNEWQAGGKEGRKKEKKKEEEKIFPIFFWTASFTVKETQPLSFVILSHHTSYGGLDEHNKHFWRSLSLMKEIFAHLKTIPAKESQSENIFLFILKN